MVNPLRGKDWQQSENCRWLNWLQLEEEKNNNQVKEYKLIVIGKKA